MPPKELNILQPPPKESCFYMVTCGLCDEQETCQKDQDGHAHWLVKHRMQRVGAKILVMSNKGGVGKSTVTANLAACLKLMGYRVGVVDIDIHGPNIPKIFGCEQGRFQTDPEGGMTPVYAYNIALASMGFLIEDPDLPIVWRDAYKYEFINQLLGGVNWGTLDFLLVDLPPGTGNESITTIDFIREVTGAVIVTTPQDVALLDSRKSVTFVKDSELQVIGMVENMSGWNCQHCGEATNPFKSGGGEKAAKDLDVPFLGRIPMDPELLASCDRGLPYVYSAGDSPAAKAFHEIAAKVEGFVKQSDIPVMGLVQRA
jgi:ATP-binding protein involved in chromosome partitioning